MTTTRIDTCFDGSFNLNMNNVQQTRNGRFLFWEGYGSGAIGIEAGALFIRDTATGKTEMAVTAPGGKPIGDAYDGHISEDGRYIVFRSARNGLVAGDEDGDWDYFRYDRQTKTSSYAVLAPDGQPLQDVDVVGMSPNGRYLMVLSPIGDLDGRTTSSTAQQLYRYDTQTREYLRASFGSWEYVDLRDIADNGDFSWLLRYPDGGKDEWGNPTYHYEIDNGSWNPNPRAREIANSGAEVSYFDFNIGYMSYYDAATKHSASLGKFIDSGGSVRHVTLADGGRYVVFVSDFNPLTGKMDDAGLYVWDTYRGTQEQPAIRRVADLQHIDSLEGVSISADGHWITFAFDGNLAGVYRSDNPFWSGYEADPKPDATIVGSLGEDYLLGTSGNDLIRALDGWDVVHGGGGNDEIHGDQGSDHLYGDQGDDTLYGGEGVDHLEGGDGNDVLHVDGDGAITGPYASPQRAEGGDGDDEVWGGGGIDWLSGDKGNDELHGEGGSDSLDGGDGNDTLHGGDGRDGLYGGEGDDELNGDAGTDHFYMEAGNDKYDGGTDEDHADRDWMTIYARPDEFVITDVPANGGTAAFVRMESEKWGIDEIKNVEVAEFMGLRTNVATMGNLYVALAEAADIAYSNTNRMGHGWTSLTSLELGIKQFGQIDGISTSYTFANGVYSAVAPAPVGGDAIEAAAHVYYGVVDGKKTLMLAFRGTDTIATDGQDYPQFQLHYQRFEPLIKAVMDYVNDDHHGERIDQVLVSGHSLGGAMVQMFMQDDRVFNDPRFTAATFGSPGAEHHQPDDRIIHFEHSADPVPLAADFARAVQGGFDDGMFGAWDRLLGGAITDWLAANNDPTDFHTAGGVVRLSTDDRVGLGLPQHSMTTYVNSLISLAQQAGRFPFMTQGTPGLGGKGHVDLAIGTQYADVIQGSDPFFVGRLRGEAYYAGDELISGGMGADRIAGGGGRDIFAGTKAELAGDTILDMAGGEVIRVYGANIQQGDIVYTPSGLSGGVLTLAGTSITIGGFHPGTFTVKGRVGGANGYTDIVYTGALDLFGSDDGTILAGGDGGDTLTGGKGRDVLSGGDGADTLVGDRAGNGLASGAAAGDADVLIGGRGADTMSGGAGRDTFVVGADATDRITDFAVGAGGDLIDLSQVMAALSLGADQDPFAWQLLRIEARDGGAAIVIDPDGPGAGKARDVVFLDGVAAADLTAAHFGGIGTGTPPLLALLGDAPVTYRENTAGAAAMANLIVSPGARPIAGGGFTIESNNETVDLALARTAGLKTLSIGGETMLATADGTILGRIVGLGTHAVTVTGMTAAMTPAQLNAVLRGFTVAIPGDDPLGDTWQVVRLTMRLGGQETSVEQRLNVIAIEDPTVTGRDHYITGTKGVVAGNLLDNDVDPDTNLLVDYIDGTYVGTGYVNTVTLASGARLTIHDNGAFSYDAKWIADGVTADHFTYTLRSGVTETVEVRLGSASSGTIGTADDDQLWGDTDGHAFDLSQGGRDLAVGGAGDDIVYFGAAFDAGDRVSLGGGEDRIVLQGNYATTIAAAQLVGVERLVLQSGSAASLDYALTFAGSLGHGRTLVVDGGALRAGEMLAFDGRSQPWGSGFEVIGGAGDDVLRGGEGADRLDGGLGNDRLHGGAGDTLAGGAGNDIYYVTEGAQIVEATGGGNDIVYAAGDFWLADDAEIERVMVDGHVGRFLGGNAAANRLDGNAGDDRIDGGAGADVMAGRGGNDEYWVDDARDRVIEAAGGGIDTVNTSLARYTLGADVEDLRFTGAFDGFAANGAGFVGVGNALANEITGGWGNDRLSGLAGDDTLVGGWGRDVLIGGAGADQLFGGGDGDVFVFGALADLTRADDARLDRIADFSRGERDRIDLSGIDADAGAAGDQAFAFLGGGAFTGAAGQMRIDHADGVARVAIDVDGDRIADHAFEVVTAQPLVQADFAL